jgi:protein-L-isoaspartate(D-aspartate) O-methyltransferase
MSRLSPAATDLPADLRRRARMVRDQLADCPDPRVVAAMADLPRQAFVPAGLRASAYDDTPLAIGCGQTISQPRLVARMLALLELRPGMTVLDVGAGSGYAAAVLARLVGPHGRVVAVERQGDLVAATRQVLAVHAPAVELVHGDALDTAADLRCDAIHIACAWPVIPAALLARLAPAGVLIAPAGEHERGQHLLCCRAGRPPEVLEPVLFVRGLAGLA